MGFGSVRQISTKRVRWATIYIKLNTHYGPCEPLQPKSSRELESTSPPDQADTEASDCSPPSSLHRSIGPAFAGSMINPSGSRKQGHFTINVEFVKHWFIICGGDRDRIDQLSPSREFTTNTLESILFCVRVGSKIGPSPMDAAKNPHSSHLRYACGCYSVTFLAAWLGLGEDEKKTLTIKTSCV